jgi:hypothetical protein
MTTTKTTMATTVAVTVAKTTPATMIMAVYEDDDHDDGRG